MDMPQYSPQKKRAEQWQSRAYFPEELFEGSVEKEHPVEGKNSPTSGSQELKHQQMAEAEAEVELEHDSEQNVHG